MNTDDAPAIAPSPAAQEPIAAPVPEPKTADAMVSVVARPSIVLLASVTIVSLAADLATKWWALHTLEKPMGSGDGIAAPIVINSAFQFLLARNRGGAWGLLQNASESVRRPFFLIISLAAIAFIVYLYRRVHVRQHALKWGLPLVLGGAIGNLVDRIRYGWVIDFIDYRAGWVEGLNRIIAKLSSSHTVTDHWPTFNVADIAICIGVGLMAIDMFTSRRDTAAAAPPPSEAAPPSEPAA